MHLLTSFDLNVVIMYSLKRLSSQEQTFARQLDEIQKTHQKQLLGKQKAISASCLSWFW
jgi:hypothetical protein